MSNKNDGKQKDGLPKKLKSRLAVRNGGVNSISRDLIHEYVSKKHKEGQESRDKGNYLIREVKDFKDAIERDPVIRMCFYGALDGIPQGGILHDTEPEHFYHILSSICVSPPKYENQHVAGVPIYALFMDFMDTHYGQAFFANPIVNQHLKRIFNAYEIMLMSPISLKYVNEEEPDGWMCPSAQKHCNWDDYDIDKSKPHWGFKSWNEWFIRGLREGARPIDQSKKAILHSSDSYPLHFPKGIKGSNPYKGVMAENKFWLKDVNYSLYDMIAAKQQGMTDLVDRHLVGGTVYQAYLDPWCYHRWHSPVDGTIIRSYKLGGTYFLDNPSMTPVSEGGPQQQHFLESQPMLSVVAVRQVYIIRVKDQSEKSRYVVVIEIGMGEVSSCQATVVEGQEVKKGDQLGYFAFGGSSYAMIFDKDLDLQFKKETFEVTADGKPKLQLVNSLLATYK